MNEQDIYIAAMDHKDLAERQQYLDQACAGDSALRERVESLIRQSDQIGSFLEHPPIDVTPAEEDARGESGEKIDATIVCGDDGSTDANEIESISPGQPMRQNPHASDSEVSLHFLEPSENPASLGRLSHYEVLNMIGQGAFGTVLRAFDEKLQRVVAIKVLSPDLAATSPPRKRFLREARSSARVRHDNVVGIYAVEDDPTPCLVMEYIPGKTLQERLDEHGPLDLLDVLRIGKQIADGLAAAHGQDLIHRDIKPGNILLEEGVDDRVKITDFGLARTVDDASMTQTGVIAGTPLYMAPEQVRGDKLDHRTDLFSLGSVLYQMLTGRPPFRASTTMGVLKRVTEDSPRSIQEVIPETPDWMCQIVNRLHAKDPKDRFDSAREVSNLLGQCLIDLEAGRTPEIPVPARTKSRVVDTSDFSVSVRKSIFQSHWVTAAALLLVMLAGLGITEATGVTRIVASMVVRWTTPNGVLVIESNDPGIKVAINGEEITIHGGGIEELKLRPGDYTVSAYKGGKLVRNEIVSITQNGRIVLNISLESTQNLQPPSGPPELPGDPVVAKQQVEEVRQELKRLNPGFDETTLDYKIEDGVVVELSFLSDHVTDISPVGKLTGLKSLNCSGSWRDFHFTKKTGQSRFADLSPLQGLKLVSLECNGTEVVDLSPLRGMPLEHLSLAVTSVSDLSAIDPQPLTYLNLGRTHVTDTELGHFEGCKNLISLILANNRVSDAGLARFKDCENLSILNLRATQITDAGLADFERCPWNSLDLALTQLTDAGVGHLQNCEGLTSLSLGETSVSDAGLKQFQNCTKLKALDLNSTLVTDAGIGQFQNCKGLTFLWIKGTQVTNAGLAQFKDCKLTNAWIDQTKVTDLSLLKTMPVEWLVCDIRTDHDANILRSIETLQWINFRPAAEFWKDVKLPRQFNSGQFLNIISLIDTEHDKWDVPSLTGKNEWRKLNSDLIAVYEDGKAHKLVFPLDSDWAAFECELDLTRRSGTEGFAINIPTQQRDCPLNFGFPGEAGVMIGNPKKQAETVAEEGDIETGTRIKFRIIVRRGEQDEIELWRDAIKIGSWTGDCERLAQEIDEGDDLQRRISLFAGRGSEFVFHTIRLKMLDGGTATALRAE